MRNTTCDKEFESFHTHILSALVLRDAEIDPIACYLRLNKDNYPRESKKHVNNRPYIVPPSFTSCTCP